MSANPWFCTANVCCAGTEFYWIIQNVLVVFDACDKHQKSWLLNSDMSRIADNWWIHELWRIASNFFLGYFVVTSPWPLLFEFTFYAIWLHWADNLMHLRHPSRFKDVHHAVGGVGWMFILGCFGCPRNGCPRMHQFATTNSHCQTGARQGK